MNIPQDLKFTKDHEWVKIDENVATIGITDFAQKELGDIVFIDVDTVDEEIEKDEIFGSIEAVKTVSDLLMPIAGTVTEFNEILEDEPEKVNSNPYDEGWIIKVEISDESQINELLSSEQYSELINA